MVLQQLDTYKQNRRSGGWGGRKEGMMPPFKTQHFAAVFQPVQMPERVLGMKDLEKIWIAGYNLSLKTAVLESIHSQGSLRIIACNSLREESRPQHECPIKRLLNKPRLGRGLCLCLVSSPEGV